MNVIGIDPSWRRTGVATIDGRTATVTSDEKLPRITRLAQIIDSVLGYVYEVAIDDLDLVVVEGYSYGHGNNLARAAELGGVLRHELEVAEIPWLEVPPKSLKKYATGNGSSSKAGMVVAARERLGYEGLDDNEADAAWLRAFGLAVLGEPMVPLPKTHVVAIDRWHVRNEEEAS